MPIYQYKCDKCGNVFDYKQSIKDEPLTKCPELVCKQDEKCTGNVSRVFSKNIGLVFKGSGFYLTDYVNNKASVSRNGSDETKTAVTAKDTSNSNGLSNGSASKPKSESKSSTTAV